MRLTGNHSYENGVVENIIRVQTFALDYIHIWLFHHSIEASGLIILVKSVAWRKLLKEVRMIEGSILTYIYRHAKFVMSGLLRDFLKGHTGVFIQEGAFCMGKILLFLLHIISQLSTTKYFVLSTRSSTFIIVDFDITSCSQQLATLSL
jgi:hypothetical protein